MKKYLVSIIMLLALMFGSLSPVWAELSETKIADAAIVSGRGFFLGIFFVTDATNEVTVNIYDNASAASGKKLIPTDTIITTAAANRIQAIGFEKGEVPYMNGIYVDITCAGTVSYIVYYTE